MESLRTGQHVFLQSWNKNHPTRKSLSTMHCHYANLLAHWAPWEDVPASYHDGACGFSFADGHAEMHKWQDETTKAPILKVNLCSSTTFTSQHDNAWMVQRTSAAH
ncbi:hypothetical protein Cflav_PD5632 [Pedosphaera parvula Ellin514]|uniref:Uncharacterized protein n=1 Tax=Pedosphaera parvula (strain Ellin514) TaxID=320771 RepID=B9XAG2_PEDPL|nr:hypothetical protein Cflav_PD5632 [Pedosphaera parvula Ellin514]